MFKYLSIIASLPLLLMGVGYNEPDAPTDLTLQAIDADSISLHWQDNSDDELGFKIYRDGELIKTTTAGVETYTDDGLNPHTTYTYIIYAYNASYPSEGTYVKTEKNSYTNDEVIDVEYRKMSGDAQDWVGIYPKGSSNEWENVLHWSFTDGLLNGVFHFAALPVGEYEARAFFDNTYDLEATYIFSVKEVAIQKKLILAEGNAWWPKMAENMITNHDKIKNLPFSGYGIVGNSFTNETMINKAIRDDNGLFHPTFTYERVWNEIKGLKDLYNDKDNFLQINIDFPGDLWDDDVWNRTTANFAIVAKAAKDVNFKGIIFDNEAYPKHGIYNLEHKYNAKQMINFKFPTNDEVTANPAAYAPWEIAGSDSTWVDEHAYRNMAHTFQQHTDKVSSRFKAIMIAMLQEFPDMRTLVYHTPALSHNNYNRDTLNSHGQGLPRSHELMGPIFLGLKQGLNDSAKLYDMGEMYKYRVDSHFEQSYQFRKFNIAKESYSDLDASYQWQISLIDRTTYSSKVDAGFMVFNGLEVGTTYDGYYMASVTNLGDIKAALKLSLKNADEYAIYYCHDQDWLLPGDNPITPDWRSMMQEVYDNR